MPGIGTRARRLVVGAAAGLFAGHVSAPASGREGAPVAGLLVERTVTAVVTVHGDGRPPGVSEVTGFERRVDPSGRTISQGQFPVQPGAVEPLGVFGCSGRGDAPGFRDHSEAVGPVRLDVDVAGDAARSAFHVYSLAGGRGVEVRSTLQVLVCMAGGGRAGGGRRLVQAGVGAAYDDPPLPPATDENSQVTVIFALGVRPEGAGKAVGVEVHDRQGGKLRKQVFREQVYVCSVPSIKVDDCPGVEHEQDVFGEFEDEVKGISGRRTKQ